VGEYEYHLIEEVRAGRMTRRDLVRRATVAGLSLPTIGALLSACGGNDNKGSSSTDTTSTESSGPVKRGGTGRFGITVPASDVDPVTMFNTGAIMTSQVAGEYLVFPDPEYNLMPKLATEWNGVQPDVWEFTIRQGVKWHDGSNLTVDDVVATFERLTDPKSNSAALSAFGGVLTQGGTEKVDDQTVRFNLERGFVDFPYLLSSFNYNAIILPANYEIGTFTNGGIGTGPFVLTEYTAKRGVKFEKNPNYWDKGKPYMDAVEIKYFDDTPPIVLALQAGEIDAFPQTPFQGSQALFQDPEITVLESSSSEYRTVVMRVDKDPFKDKQVRQAIASCLDREALVQGLFDGRAEVGNDHGFAPIYPPSKLALTEVPQRTQDYDKAKQLLADAGLSGGIDVELTTEQFLEIPQYAVTIKEQCKPAGINITLNIQDQATYYGTGKNQPWLQAPFNITDWGARGSASQTIGPAYLCVSVPKPDLSNSGAWNASYWCDEEFDSLVAAFDAELDEQKRMDIAVQAATLQNEEVPAIIGYWIKEQRATRKNVKGLAAGPTFHLEPSAMWLDT
jgi:peptide/nickel transport system substrate-binding protein